MKKIYDALSVTALFVFFYHFSWELYPTIILGVFAVAFSISNIFDIENSSFTMEEYLLFAFAIVAAVTIYMYSNWIGMVAIGTYIALLIQKSTMDDQSKRGMTNKEYYNTERSRDGH